MTTVTNAILSQNEKGKTETVSFTNPTTKAVLQAPVKRREYISKYAKSKGYKPETFVVMTPELRKVVKEIVEHAKLFFDQTAKDSGTCVLGAGVAMQCYHETKDRKPQKLLLIRQPFQGNVGSYKALKPCLDWLEKNYPELGCYWEDGNMD